MQWTSAPCKDAQQMAGTNFSLEGEQAGRQCDITCNCRMLLTQCVSVEFTRDA